MYYEFRRYAPKTQNGHRTQPVEPFSGWASTWDGVIKEASNALQWAVGLKVENLIQWSNTNGITWYLVGEKKA